MVLKRKSGFTLIELLIVVAIIAILAAIAIPNFLAAQIRAKVSRAKGEMRSLATALEAYRIDQNDYPWWYFGGIIPGYNIPVSRRLNPLTTPVSYISRVPGPDPFAPQSDTGGPTSAYNTYDYVDMAASVAFFGQNNASVGSDIYGREWRLASAGPDRVQYYGGSDFSVTPPIYGFYDPSNGTVSNGDIVRLGPKANYYTQYDLGFDPP